MELIIAILTTYIIFILIKEFCYWVAGGKADLRSPAYKEEMRLLEELKEGKGKGLEEVILLKIKKQ